MPGKRILLSTVLIVAISTLLITSGCAVIAGSGTLLTRNFENSGFTKVEIGYAFEAVISQEDSFTVEITLDDNLFEYLDISQSGETLTITMKPGNVFTNVTQRVIITLPDLERLELSGASQGNVTDFTSLHDIDFKLSGASQMDISGVSSPDIILELSGASSIDGSMTMTNGSFDLSGASSITLDGSAQGIRVDASGASQANLDDFIILNARINLSGASDATVNISGQLTGDISGASTIYYIGDPTLIDVAESGASSVKPR